MKEKYDEMFELGKPLVKWLNDNGHPHHKIIIETDRIELVEGEACYTTDEFIKD